MNEATKEKPATETANPVEPLVMRFQHDCKHCVPLGQYQENDLYYCDQHGCPTVIARYGNDGPEYTSGMGFAEIDPRLSIALLMAKAMGLVSAVFTPDELQELINELILHLSEERYI